MTRTFIPHPSHPQAAETARLLAARYLDAETSREEEEWLLRFVCSPAGADAEWDGLRAVLSFTAMGRQAATQPAQSRRPRWKAAAVAAVCVGLAVGAGFLWHDLRPSASAQPDQCIAYVGGERITDQTEVRNLMRESLSSMAANEETDIVSEQLSDMLLTPNE